MTAPTIENPLVKLVGISKSFGQVVALKGVDLTLKRGELHFVLGENGAGKTTLMRILAGIQTPDAGEILVHGELRRLRSRRDGIKAGVGMVQQHHGLISELTGVENFLLGRIDAGALLRKGAASRQLQQAADEMGLEIRPNRMVSAMSAGERQRLEIVIALASGSEVIILDEPTSALPSRDVDTLIEVVGLLKRKGRSVAYITHKLREVIALADQVTILRRGEVVAQLPGKGLDVVTLTSAMMGSLPASEAVAHREPGPIVARLRKVTTRREGIGCPLQEVDLSVRGREVVGIAGMANSGQSELAELLAGLRAPMAGAVETRPRTCAYIPEDRAASGIAENLSVRDNCLVHRHRDPALRRGLMIDRKKADAFANSIVAGSDVRTSGIEGRVGLLSGGNQQKLVVGRELDRDPDLIVAHNPYYGLDVNAARAVRDRLLQARDRGCALVFLSPDIEDLFEVADRIVVMAEGSVIGEVDPRTTSSRELGEMIGQSKVHAP
jgi:general nucleoside transport system ATP-binding protein